MGDVFSSSLIKPYKVTPSKNDALVFPSLQLFLPEKSPQQWNVRVCVDMILKVKHQRVKQIKICRSKLFVFHGQQFPAETAGER